MYISYFAFFQQFLFFSPVSRPVFSPFNGNVNTSLQLNKISNRYTMVKRENKKCSSLIIVYLFYIIGSHAMVKLPELGNIS